MESDINQHRDDLFQFQTSRKASGNLLLNVLEIRSMKIAAAALRCESGAGEGLAGIAMNPVVIARQHSSSRVLILARDCAERPTQRLSLPREIRSSMEPEEKEELITQVPPSSCVSFTTGIFHTIAFYLTSSRSHPWGQSSVGQSGDGLGRGHAARRETRTHVHAS